MAVDSGSQSCSMTPKDGQAPQPDAKVPSLAFFFCLVSDLSASSCGTGLSMRLHKLLAEQQARRVLEMIGGKKDLIKQSR